MLDAPGVTLREARLFLIIEQLVVFELQPVLKSSYGPGVSVLGKGVAPTIAAMAGMPQVSAC